MIVYARNQLNAQRPGDLQANIEESLTVFDDEKSSTIRPDINVSAEHDPLRAFPSSQIAQGAVVAEPLLLLRPPHPTRHLEIADHGGRVIAAIEFVSPWNKVGKRARERYTRKQLNYMDTGINLVEIDLVRQGSYVLAAPLEDIAVGIARLI